jgi:penicillin V acylase-like amidase (Ntn superfamily)
MSLLNRIVAVLAIALALSTACVFACTTFCLKNKGEVLFGKNYDWMIGDGMIFVNKRGVSKAADNNGNPAKWVSKYGSVTFNQYGRENPSGGMNEAGLVIELMWLNDTQYPAPDSRPEVDVLEWIQYNLDTAATVEEVIKSAEQIRISSPVKIHYLVNDKAGNSATVEFLDGKLAAHTGADLPVAALTNDTYARSIDFAKKTDPATSTTVSSLDRFARASKKINDFAGQARTEKEAVDYAFGILINAAQPGYTQWSIVYDQKRGQIYFRTQKSPAIKSIDTRAFDYTCGSAIKMLDIDLKDTGEAGPKFIDYTRAANRDLIERAFTGTPFLKAVPSAAKDRMAAVPESFSCSVPVKTSAPTKPGGSVSGLTAELILRLVRLAYI